MVDLERMVQQRRLAPFLREVFEWDGVCDLSPSAAGLLVLVVAHHSLQDQHTQELRLEIKHPPRKIASIGLPGGGVPLPGRRHPLLAVGIRQHHVPAAAHSLLVGASWLVSDRNAGSPAGFQQLRF